MRIKILRIMTAVLFLTVAADLVYVQAIQGKRFFKLSTNNRIRVVPLEGWRGRIYDRNGRILADNKITYNVLLTPQEIIKEKKDYQTRLFEFIGEVLGTDVSGVEALYQKRRLNNFTPIVLFEDIEREQAIVLEENRYRFPGLLVQEGFRRFYPLEKNSAHVLGYVGKISRAKYENLKEYGISQQAVTGYSGIEEYYNAYLKGEEGGLQIEVNNRGQQTQLLGLRQPTKGQDIRLTLDVELQETLDELFDGHTGAGIVMDMDSGEILGMVSSPGYDPNVFLDNRFQRKRQVLFSHSASPLLNRAIKGLYPPGSVFKVLVALGGLDSRKVSPHTTFDCEGVYILGGIKFGCTHIHGLQNLTASISHSCNIYYYRLGQILKQDLLERYARLLGLGSETHIDLPYEEKGNVPSRRQRWLTKKERWYAGHTLNMAIGQGDTLVTPIQLVKMMATIANDGVEVQPHVIQAIGGKETDQSSSKRKLKIRQQALDTVKKGMRAVVTEYSGTAHILDIDGLYVAGKTGTAQSSGDLEDHAWFVGYMLGEKRRLAFCVFLEHGGSSQNANLVARDLLLSMQQKEML